MSPDFHSARAGLVVEEVLLGVAEAGRLLEVLGVDRRLLVPADVGDLAVELAQVGRGGHAADAHAAAGLVDQVDRLVGQEAVRDVAVGQVGRGDQGVVGDGDAVVGLVAVAQALEDVDGVGHRRLLDLDRLEAPLQRGVLLQVLAVLLEGGGADRLQLAPGQHRLEDRGGVDRALGAPAPTRVWSSSMNRTMSPRVRISLRTFLRRSSKSPR
jgi:hypothetical protein